MKLEALSCNKCGAPLDVPSSANFATCSYCNSRLAIKREGGAHYTEVLDRIDTRTERMSGDLTAVRLHSELERLDREWHQADQGFTTRVQQSKSATLSHKGASAIYLWPVIGLATGIFLLVVAVALILQGNFSLGSNLCLLPVLLIPAAGVALAAVRSQLAGYNSLVKTHNELVQEYTNAEKSYVDRRTKITYQLEQDPLEEIPHG